MLPPGACYLREWCEASETLCTIASQAAAAGPCCASWTWKAAHPSVHRSLRRYQPPLPALPPFCSPYDKIYTKHGECECSQTLQARCLVRFEDRIAHSLEDLANFCRHVARPRCCVALVDPLSNRLPCHFRPSLLGLRSVPR